MHNEIEKAVSFLKALADVNRMKIVSILLKSNTDLSVADIASKLNISQPATSQHIKILKYAGLLTSTKDGNKVYYHVDVEKLMTNKELFDALFAYGLSDECHMDN